MVVYAVPTVMRLCVLRKARFGACILTSFLFDVSAALQVLLDHGAQEKDIIITSILASNIGVHALVRLSNPAITLSNPQPPWHTFSCTIKPPATLTHLQSPYQSLRSPYHTPVSPYQYPTSPPFHPTKPSVTLSTFSRTIKPSITLQLLLLTPLAVLLPNPPTTYHSSSPTLYHPTKPVQYRGLALSFAVLVYRPRGCT